MNDLSSRRETSGRLRSVVGVLLLLAVMLPVQIRRAGMEEYWWVDENESVLLASGPVARIFDYSSNDTNPPGYFLALKPWLALGRLLRGERGVLWARMPAVLVWTLLAIFLWFKGRALFGPIPGAALAWAVCASSYADWFIPARGFGISSAAVLAAGLLLCGLIRDAAAEPPRLGGAGTWFAYVLCAEAALWTHLTSMVALGLLAGIWLVASWRLHARAPRLLRDGFVAHAAIGLAFLPELVHLGDQMAARRNEDSWWVTPATLKQWLLVFFRWYPFGDTDLPRQVWLPLGILTLLVPLAAALAVARRGRPGSPAARLLASTAAAALAVAVVFTSILWGVQRFLGISVFHGPRYPCLVLGFWALGLALLAAWAVTRAGWRGGAVWLLLVPWLLAGWMDLADDLSLLKAPVSAFARAKQRRWMPPPGEILFVLPPALAPFTRHVLAGWKVRPATDLACALAEMGPEGEAWVLDLNFLNMLDEVNDTVLIGAVGGKVLARDVSVHQIPPPQYYTLYHLRGPRFWRTRKICAEGGLRPAPPPIPAGAAAVALPQSQRLHDGWWWPEVDTDLAYRRWWSRPQTRLLFDRTVPAGDYVLHYRGFCPGHEKEPADLRLRLEGSSLDVHLPHPAGEVAADLPVHVDGTARVPVLLLEHTMESTDAIGRSDMPVNFVGSTLRYAWLERR